MEKNIHANTIWAVILMKERFSFKPCQDLALNKKNNSGTIYCSLTKTSNDTSSITKFFLRFDEVTLWGNSAFLQL